MASFQKIILFIAAIVLFLVFAVVIYAFYNSKGSGPWPPLTSTCPDYWVDLSGNGSNCYNKMNLGTCSNQTNMDFTAAPYIGSGGNCAKYTWATNCGLTWDGITYGAPLPCG